MASVAISYSPFDMHAMNTWYGTLTASDASHISISSGAVTATYFGNFSYDASGNVSGTWTGYSVTIGAYTALTVSGLNVSASYAEQMINSDQLQALFQTAFSGDDQFTATAGIHVIDGYGGVNTMTEPLGYSSYSISVSGSATIVGSAVSNDTLYNIQAVQFADGVYDTGTHVFVSNATLQSVQAANQGILRAPASATTARQEGVVITTGASGLGLTQLVTALIGQAATSTVPALVTFDAFYGATPGSSGLDYLANYTQQLQTEGFSLLNAWVNLGASFAANGTFGAQYAALSRDAFVDSVYTTIFGYAPSADAHSTLVNSMNFYASYAGSELGARGAIEGILLYSADQAPTSKYAVAATNFLTHAAAGTAKYGAELISVYGPGGTQ